MKILKKFVSFLLVAGIVAGGGFWWFKTKIAPYSSRYSGRTINVDPNGVETTVAAKNEDGSVRTASQLLLKPIQAEAAASNGFNNSASFSVNLQDSKGHLVAAASPLTVTLTSSSQSGRFDSGTAVQIDAGKTGTTVKYSDTSAGPAQITAFVSGLVGSSVNLHIKPGPTRAISELMPPVKSPTIGQQQIYSVLTEDDFGNLTTGESVEWSLQLPNVSSAGSSPVPADTNGKSSYLLTPDASQLGQGLVLKAKWHDQTKLLVITPKF